MQHTILPALSDVVTERCESRITRLKILNRPHPDSSAILTGDGAAEGLALPSHSPPGNSFGGGDAKDSVLRASSSWLTAVPCGQHTHATSGAQL